MQPLRGRAGLQGLALPPPRANEEAIYVLEGSGTLRIGEEEVPISKGDYVTFPAAREEGAHQLVNTSNSTLRYLCFSTMIEPDAMIYPGSGKIGGFVERPPAVQGRRGP